MTEWAVSALGDDRPGIIAGICERLAARGLNITDSQMGILRGRFAVTLIVDGDAEGLVLDDLGLDAVTVRELGTAHPTGAAEPTHRVSVHGADHPGIVAAVTRALADAFVNVCDAHTRLLDPDGLYVMLLEVAAPPDVDVAALLAEPAAAQGVRVAVAELDADVL